MTHYNTNKPWDWEGNVQFALARYLEKQKYTIIHESDTENRERGKDIEAKTPENKTLWISVKGWPQETDKTKPTNQAQKWFAQAIFDIIKWLEESKDKEVLFALAFPAGKVTYQNKRKQINKFKELANFKIYWISENGVSAD